jgi:hypothetical protein
MSIEYDCAVEICDQLRSSLERIGRSLDAAREDGWGDEAEEWRVADQIAAKLYVAWSVSFPPSRVLTDEMSASLHTLADKAYQLADVFLVQRTAYRRRQAELPEKE